MMGSFCGVTEEKREGSPGRPRVSVGDTVRKQRTTREEKQAAWPRQKLHLAVEFDCDLISTPRSDVVYPLME